LFLLPLISPCFFQSWHFNLILHLQEPPFVLTCPSQFSSTSLFVIWSGKLSRRKANTEFKTIWENEKDYKPLQTAITALLSHLTTKVTSICLSER